MRPNGRTHSSLLCPDWDLCVPGCKDALWIQHCMMMRRKWNTLEIHSLSCFQEPGHWFESQTPVTTQQSSYPHLQLSSVDMSPTGEAPPPLPVRRNQATLTSPTSPSLVVTHPSPFTSPRSSQQVSPHVSPWNSPRNSPRSSPFASPCASPAHSPHVSPAGSPFGSPQQSPLVGRRGPPPPPPQDSDEDSPPPAVPERRYKAKGVESKKGKATASGYIDVAAAMKSPNNSQPTTSQTNYAQLAYPAPGSSSKSTESSDNDENPSYDIPLPILLGHGGSLSKRVLRENGIDSQSLEPVAEPFAEDPFKSDEISKDFGVGGFSDAFASQVALPPKRPSRDTPCTNPRQFFKAQSTEGALDRGRNNAAMAEVKSSRNSSTPDILNVPSSNSNSLQHKRNSRPALVSRNSWSGPGESNNCTDDDLPSGFDPSKLTASEDGEMSKEDMQFYEEDFQILEAQGYSRDEIKRALIVAENNFAMARKILREFSHVKRSWLWRIVDMCLEMSTHTSMLLWHRMAGEFSGQYCSLVKYKPCKMLYCRCMTYGVWCQ